MAKNKSKFPNKAARRFVDLNKIETLPEGEIYDILFADLDIILGQFTAFRLHKPNSAYPNYMANAFANVSTAKFFYQLVRTTIKVTKKAKVKSDVFDEEDLESLRMILAEAYKKNNSGYYQSQALDDHDRVRYIEKAFIQLCPDIYDATKKLEGLKKSQRRALTINVYGDPIYTMRNIHKIVNNAKGVSDKKKMNFFKRVFSKKKFVRMIGAAMTVENNASDCIAMLFDYMEGQKKKRRIKILKAYAEAFKKNKSRYFRINQEFIDDNHKIIKHLVKSDAGFKKAFRVKITKDADFGRHKNQRGNIPNKKQ